MKKYIFWGFAGLSSFLISLVIMMPLTTLAQQIIQWKPTISFAGVTGTLWNGSIDYAKLSPALELRELNWQFAPATLLRGYLGFDIPSVQFKSVRGRGQCGMTFFLKLHCEALTVRADAARLRELSPRLQRSPVQLEGNLLAFFQEITWDQENMPLMDGELSWDNGKIKGAISLDLGGEYKALMSHNSQNETLVDLRSRETSIILSGTVRAEPQGAYNMEIFVRAADTAPPTTGAALELALEGIGAPQNDGSIRLQQAGQIPVSWFKRNPVHNDNTALGLLQE